VKTDYNGFVRELEILALHSRLFKDRATVNNLSMIQNNFEAILFDCDGTLVDSEPITNNVLADYAGEFGVTMSGEEAFALFVGRDMNGIVTVLESRLGEKLPDHFCDEFRKRQATALREELQAIDGAHEMLKAMTKPFCVASNAPREKIQINLTVTGLDAYFTPELTFSAYDIQAWKPKPDLFLHAAEKMKIAPVDCVVIEDSPAGIEAGLAAGMQVIGYSSHEDTSALSQTDGVPFVNKLIDLIPVLTR
jgi:HAD superfamily hydrolase (TIGR01509 family)